MRIDVITLQAVNNYGSVLQTFATQEFMRQHGCDVRIINYKREDLVANLNYSNALTIALKYNRIMLPAKFLLSLLAVPKIKRVFEEFRVKHLNLVGKCRTTMEDFADYESDADAFCTGSDQVWNSYWNRGILPQFYLSFAPKGSYKFAFSASFGKSEIDPDEVEQTQKYINDYRHISVREDSAVRILNEQYHYNKAVHVLDPTLCLSGNTWREYAKSPLRGGGYILIYCIYANREEVKRFNAYADELSRRTGLRVIRICPGYGTALRKIFSNETLIVLPEVFDFISLINNARYVLTDSFHGTAFALNLNTEPICIFPEKFGGRLESILKLTGTLDRRVKSYDDFSILDRHVDFSHVNTVLDSERRKVSEWFSMVLDEIRASK